MKIGVFGGTFDPFTLAHLAIVKEVLAQEIVDRVIIAPTIVSWHREGKSSWLDMNAKVMVIEELVNTLPMRSKVDLFLDDLKIAACAAKSPELVDEVVNKRGFIDTLLNLRARFGLDKQFYPIIGVDSWKMFKKWKNWRAVAEQSTGIIVVNGRNGDLFEPCVDIPRTVCINIDPKFATTSASIVRNYFSNADNYVNWAKSQLDDEKKKDELLLHTPILDVVRGSKTETGLKPVKINAPDWVSLIIMKDSKVLVESQFRYGSNCMIEEFPCGQVEKGEEPLDAAIRELEEETGIKLLDKTQVKKIGAVNPNPAFMTNTMHYFAVDLGSAEFVQVDKKLDEHEQITSKWVDSEEFLKSSMKAASDGSKQIPALLVASVGLIIHNSIFANKS